VETDEERRKQTRSDRTEVDEQWRETSEEREIDVDGESVTTGGKHWWLLDVDDGDNWR
jgi:hypothetical protein